MACKNKAEVVIGASKSDYQLKGVLWITNDPETELGKHCFDQWFPKWAQIGFEKYSFFRGAVIQTTNNVRLKVQVFDTRMPDDEPTMKSQNEQFVTEMLDAAQQFICPEVRGDASNGKMFFFLKKKQFKASTHGD